MKTRKPLFLVFHGLVRSILLLFPAESTFLSVPHPHFPAKRHNDCRVVPLDSARTAKIAVNIVHTQGGCFQSYKTMYR
ncbi:hypothetical protein F5Y10DRAFT_144215 [Nemania abortiva]|nr:hypothetical protein F5Y10DRAFT_144215 [Nemania abortiva]